MLPPYIVTVGMTLFLLLLAANIFSFLAPLSCCARFDWDDDAHALVSNPGKWNSRNVFCCTCLLRRSKAKHERCKIYAGASLSTGDQPFICGGLCRKFSLDAMDQRPAVCGHYSQDVSGKLCELASLNERKRCCGCNKGSSGTPCRIQITLQKNRRCKHACVAFGRKEIKSISQDGECPTPSPEENARRCMLQEPLPEDTVPFKSGTVSGVDAFSVEEWIFWHSHVASRDPTVGIAIRSILQDTGLPRSGSLIRYDSGDIVSLDDAVAEQARSCPRQVAADVVDRQAVKAVSNLGIILSLIHYTCVGVQMSLVVGGLASAAVVFGPLVFGLVNVPHTIYFRQLELAHDFAVTMISAFRCASEMLRKSVSELEKAFPLLEKRSAEGGEDFHVLTEEFYAPAEEEFESFLRPFDVEESLDKLIIRSGQAAINAAEAMIQLLVCLGGDHGNLYANVKCSYLIHESLVGSKGLATIIAKEISVWILNVEASLMVRISTSLPASLRGRLKRVIEFLNTVNVLIFRVIGRADEEKLREDLKIALLARPHLSLLFHVSYFGTAKPLFKALERTVKHWTATRARTHWRFPQFQESLFHGRKATKMLQPCMHVWSSTGECTHTSSYITPMLPGGSGESAEAHPRICSRFYKIRNRPLWEEKEAEAKAFA